MQNRSGFLQALLIIVYHYRKHISHNKSWKYPVWVQCHLYVAAEKNGVFSWKCYKYLHLYSCCLWGKIANLMSSWEILQSEICINSTVVCAYNMWQLCTENVCYVKDWPFTALRTLSSYWIIFSCFFVFVFVFLFFCLFICLLLLLFSFFFKYMNGNTLFFLGEQRLMHMRILNTLSDTIQDLTFR